MHADYLQHALELAKIRRGFCAPNPAVGALLVKNQQIYSKQLGFRLGAEERAPGVYTNIHEDASDESNNAENLNAKSIIGSGYHWGSGHPHAEIEALRNAEFNAKNAVLYVTLEPCCHINKKTPPCIEAIIEHQIKEVIYAFRDPNPEVSGKGEKILREAGVECRHFPIAEINAFYASYHHWWTTKKPYVTAKLALSYDTKIAGAQGERVTLTGTKTQDFTHTQRYRADAILTTAKTIHADNPLLNVRLENKQHSKTLYVLDRFLTTSLQANIFNTAQAITFFCSSEIAAEKISRYTTPKTRCIPIATDEKGLVLTEVLQKIGEDGIHDLWIEAGGRCFSAFANDKLLQSAFIYLTPKILGATALDAFSGNNDIFENVISCEQQRIEQDIIYKLNW